jgi:hypothetical protein
MPKSGGIGARTISNRAAVTNASEPPRGLSCGRTAEITSTPYAKIVGHSTGIRRKATVTDAKLAKPIKFKKLAKTTVFQQITKGPRDQEMARTAGRRVEITDATLRLVIRSASQA